MTARVDVHHHFYAPHVNAMLDARGELPAVSKAWSVENSLADMDRSNVDRALLSATPDADLSAAMARATNEFAAALVRQHPARFGFFAALPIPDIDGCLEEIAYALDVLGAQGVGLFTSYGATYLGDAALDPVFAELDRRKAIAYTHPTLNACCADMPNGLMPELQRFYYETAQVANRGAMASLRELVPASQVLFGTDFPYRGAQEQLAGLRQCGFTGDELQAIEGPNLTRLLEDVL